MIKLRLNPNIFKMKYIDHAAKAYEKICSIKISGEDDYIVCEFSNCIYDAEETSKEFENYIIDLMNSNSL